jgi:hypothetical protein
MADEPSDFFISYTSRDEAWATWVAWRLELAGYRVVIQAWDFRGGNFVTQMEAAVRKAEWLLAILSESYLGSKWGREEWAAYLKMTPRSIIPVQIEDINTRSLLGQLQRIKLVGLAEEAAQEKLLDEINRLAGQPGHDPREREIGHFPGAAYQVLVDTEGLQDRGEMPESTVTVDRDRIQLILLGDGDDSAGAVASFRRLLDVATKRCCDLFGSDLPADAQLGKITEVVQGLDTEQVSDVLVVFAGTGSGDPDAGVRLHVRATDPLHPLTTSVISLAGLLECLQDNQHRLRSCLILDAVDAHGQPVGPATPALTPVLTLGRGNRGGHGLAEIQEALAKPLEELTEKLPHWGALSLKDLRGLVGGELVASDHSPASLVGLVPSPLAWPRRGRGDSVPGGLANWCAVISESDGRRSGGETVSLVVEKLANQSRYLLNQAYRRRGHQIELVMTPRALLAKNVLSSPRSFAHAVEQVCYAELAIFDLTNFEPAVMLLLGIRAVIRRRLTVCVAREHDPPWRDAEPPFHLREVSLVAQPDREAVQARILEGIKQLAQPGSTYCDLPCFDLIRSVPPDPEQRQTRAFDAKQNPSILALVPFDPKYGQLNWSQIKDSLPAAARDETIKRRGWEEDVQAPRLQRTLDLDSPRVVSAQLFEAIRLTDFCLVDVTSVRPNVLFELGVRLVSNRLHPVVVVDLGYRAGDDAGNRGGEGAENRGEDKGEETWLQHVSGQFKLLQRLLQPVRYSPTSVPAFSRMVERHLEFRRLLQEPGDPRAASLLGGLPPAGVYDIAWRHAAPRDEVVTMPVGEHLQSGAEALLVDRTSGQRHLIYPTRHPLSDIAEQTGREYLIAAWLYLHFRMHADEDAEKELGKKYQTLTYMLIDLLEQTGDPDDASFADQIEQWLDGGDG